MKEPKFINSPSLTHWSILLNWFDKHKDTFSIEEIEEYATESEMWREYWNQDQEKILRFNKNGKPMEQKIVVPGLDIRREDVYPNIHEYLEQKKLELEHTEDPSEEKISHRSEQSTVQPSPEFHIPLAASHK